MRLKVRDEMVVTFGLNMQRSKKIKKKIILLTFQKKTGLKLSNSF